MLRMFSHNTPAELVVRTWRSSFVGVDTLRLNEERRLP